MPLCTLVPRDVQFKKKKKNPTLFTVVSSELPYIYLLSLHLVSRLRSLRNLRNFQLHSSSLVPFSTHLSTLYSFSLLSTLSSLCLLEPKLPHPSQLQRAEYICFPTQLPLPQAQLKERIEGDQGCTPRSGIVQYRIHVDVRLQGN